MTDSVVLRAVAGPIAGATLEVASDVVLGREGDLRIDDPTASRRHVRLRPGEAELLVEDLGSASGTLVDGQPTRGPTVVRPGQVLAVGRTELVVLLPVRFHDAAATPSVRHRRDGRQHAVPVGDGVTLGRDPAADVQVDDTTVSRLHARIAPTPDGTLVLEDLGSANGTQVDGRPVTSPVTLADGAVITLGRAADQLRIAAGRGTAGTTRVRVRVEGGRAAVAEVDAHPDATVAEVTAELGQAVGAPATELLLYRGDGLLLHPDDRWSATGTRDGDELVVGPGDASALAVGAPRRWPSPRTLRLNQLPRTVHQPTAHRVQRVDAPESTSWRGRGILWQVVGGLGAIGVGLALAVVRPQYAVFGLITGGIGLVTIVASVFGEQSRRRYRVAEFRRKVAALDTELAEVQRRQADALRSLSPDDDALTRWIRHAGDRLWERRPDDADALQLRVGTGTRATALDVESGRGDSPLTAELDRTVAAHGTLPHVPVTGPGPAEGSLGLWGDPERTDRLLARMVIEAACQLPPDQLSIWVAAGDRRWEWASWLPHVAPGGLSTEPGERAEVVNRVRSEAAEARRDGSASTHLHLLVVPGGGDHLDLTGAAADLRGRGLLLVSAPTARSLPGGLAATLGIESDGTATLTGSSPGAPLGPVAVDGLPFDRAEDLAVEFGRFDAARAAAAPAGLVELLGLGRAADVDVAAAWRRGPAERLTVAVGSDDAGAPVTLGFRRDGPHGMIAGTTGSGKSELLQTLLAGLVLTHTPDLLNLFLIDYKGGATFAPLARLPHVVGMVTDLEHDTSLARRAFTALDAEIERRKRVLEAAGVPNVIEYERRAGAGAEPLPGLLVVIDEFALLVERQPEVKERLDTVATQGRSLGIHLLLATQSPSGVITHAIRTNTNLWVCLRVVTDSESVEILGNRDAARIPDGSPGRAIVRLGAGDERRAFQAARIARPAAADGPRVEVRVSGVPAGRSTAHTDTTELDLVVSGVLAACADRPPTRQLWLPPLPHHLEADQLDRPAVDPSRLEVLLGLADHPERQAQEPFVVDLSAAGNALLVGGLGSGRTTTLLQIADDLARHRDPATVHLYGIDDGTGSLAPLLALPHTGDVVGVSDGERLARLLDRLAAEIDRRRDQLAASGSGSFLRWRAAGGAAPWIVVLVDDYPALREVAEQAEAGRLLERFASLLQNGPSVGVHTVISLNQGVDLRLRELTLAPARIVFRASDAAEYGLVDVRFRAEEVPVLPPGRGIIAGGVHVQICRPEPDRFAELAAGHPAAGPRPRRVERLPVSITTDQLPDEPGIIGLGGPDVDPVRVDLDHGRPILLVAGPIGSGRSSALQAIADRCRRDRPGRTLVVALRPSPLLDLPPAATTVTAGTAEEALAGLTELVEAPQPGDLLVIDDAETLAAAYGAAERLETLLREAPTRGIRIVVAARVNDLPGMFDAWARYLVSLRRAVLLQPTADDAFLLGARLPIIPPPSVPGRGLLVEGPSTTVVQVARSASPADFSGLQGS